jgi:hypothetical protein
MDPLLTGRSIWGVLAKYRTKVLSAMRLAVLVRCLATELIQEGTFVVPTAEILKKSTVVIVPEVREAADRQIWLGMQQIKEIQLPCFCLNNQTICLERMH